MTKLKSVTAASLVCFLSACGGGGIDICSMDPACSNDDYSNVSNGTYTFSDTVALVSVEEGGDQNNRTIAATTDYDGEADLNITVLVEDSGATASGTLDVIDDGTLAPTNTGINITEVDVTGSSMTTSLTGSVDVEGTEVNLGADSFIYAVAEVNADTGNFTKVKGDGEDNTLDILIDLGADYDIGVYGYEAVAD